MKVRIIVDSTADLLPEIRSRVHVVPLTVHFGDEEYIDGVTIDHKTFYEKLVETDVLPTTSQATPSAFAVQLEAAKQAGEAAVVITLSSKLSGTYQSALIAAQDYENVYIVDSETGAIGGGILTELALQYLDAGMDAPQIAVRLNEEKVKIVIVALVDTLDYLKMGGRISKTVAFAGTLLNIKPVISVVRGRYPYAGQSPGFQARQQSAGAGDRKSRGRGLWQAGAAGLHRSFRHPSAKIHRRQQAHLGAGLECSSLHHHRQRHRHPCRPGRHCGRILQSLLIPCFLHEKEV